MNFPPKLKPYAIATLLVCSQGSFAQMGPNAYLRKPSPTHSSLMTQLQSDPVVLDRYQRHFAMTRNELVSYFNALTLVKVPKDMVFVVYNVPPKTGELRGKAMKMRKGTKIWVDSMGRAVLKESCGNPLTKGPVKATAIKLSSVSDKGAPVKEMSVEEPAVEIVAEFIPAEPEVPSVVSEAVAVIEPTEPFVTETTSNIVIAPTPWWLALPVFAGAIAIIPKGGGNPPPVPEPSSYLALALGTGALVIALRRKRLNAS